MGAENIKNHIRATSEPQDGRQFAAATKNKIKKKDHRALSPLFLSVSPRKHPSIKLSTQQHDASSNNSLLKTTPKKI